MTEGRRRARFRLYLITDRHLAAQRGGVVAMVEAALAEAAEISSPGEIAVQLREKDLDARELHELARALGKRCRRFGAPLIINDRIDVAIAADADGVHLPANSFEVADARVLLGTEQLIGVSTHRAEEIAAAAASGADFAVFGPIYEPLSKAAYGPATGPAALEEAVRSGGRMPLYALGGITAGHTAELMNLPPAARPFGVAVIGAVFGAADAAAATRELLSAMPRSF
jgi:thiamine-phosphate pyrophosphorylase